MTLDFKKYNSIENSYQKKVVDSIALKTLTEKFVVLEKVHGANYSLIYNGIDYKHAKRTSFIGEEDKFYNAHLIKAKYTKNVKALYKKVKSLFPKTKQMVVYGEIFGGSYNHPDVPKENNTSKVQKGIQYAPFNEFYAFDIFLEDVGYLDVYTFSVLMKEFNFFYAKVLFEGNLEEALKYPNDFNSKIPEWLGLPEIENNVCEGVIIKPIIPSFLPSGSRVILKNKNEKWSEKAKLEKANKPPVQLSKTGASLLNELACFINSNRLQNVMSKLGAFEPKMIGKIIGSLSQDAQEDFIKEYGKAWATLEKDEQKIIKKAANKKAIEVIKNEYMR